MRQKKKRKEIRGKKEIDTRLITDSKIRDIRTLFEQEEDHCKPKIVSSLWNNNYFEYENNGDENRNLSLDEYLNQIKPYLRNIIIDLHNSDTWKMQLTILINFISSKDVEEELIMHPSIRNVKFTSYNDADEVADNSLRHLDQDI